MALLAWRGIDGMGRAVSQTAAYEQNTQRLSITLAQWQADLDALTETDLIKALDFDGQLLRLTRRSAQPSGVVVVGWTIRAGRLLRYASPALQDHNALQTAWLAAARWGRTPLPEDAARTVDLIAARDWQIFYFRGDAWTNPQSSGAMQGTAGGAAGGSGGSGTTAQREALPDGVRLILDRSAETDFGGKVTRDWVSPALGATR